MGQRDLYYNSNSKWGGLIFGALVKQYLYIDGNHKRRVASIGNNIIYSYIVAIWRRGSSVAKSLKLLALPHPSSKSRNTTLYYLQTVATWYHLVLPTDIFSKKIKLQGNKKLLDTILYINKDGKIKYNYPKLAIVYKVLKPH